MNAYKTPFANRSALRRCSPTSRCVVGSAGEVDIVANHAIVSETDLGS